MTRCILLCGLVLAGCGGGGLHCMASGGDAGAGPVYCADYEGTGTAAQRSCSAAATQVSSCPTDNSVGTCAVTLSGTGGSGTETIHFYSPTTADQAKQSCMLAGGRFTGS